MGTWTGLRGLQGALDAVAQCVPPRAPGPGGPWPQHRRPRWRLGTSGGSPSRCRAVTFEGAVEWEDGRGGHGARERGGDAEGARVVSPRAAAVPWRPPPWRYCRDAEEVDALLQRHVYGEGNGEGERGGVAAREVAVEPGARVVGVDCEWPPVRDAGQSPGRPTVVQVSTEAMTVVAHVGAMADPTTLPASLVRVLGDARVVKAGVGVGFDVATLEQWFQVRVEGAVDVGWAAVLLGVGREWTGEAHRDLAHVGLKALVRAFGVEMQKGMGTSNWRAGRLSDAQVAYAARDAYAGVWALRNLFHARVEPLARLGGVEGGRPAPGMHAWALSLVGKFSLEAHLAVPGLGLERRASDIRALMLTAKQSAREERGLERADRRREAVYGALATVEEMRARWIEPETNGGAGDGEEPTAKRVAGGLGSSRRNSCLGSPGVDALAEVACEVVFRAVVGHWRAKDSAVRIDFGPVQALTQVAVFTGRKLLPPAYDAQGLHGSGIVFECTVTLLGADEGDEDAAAVGVGRGTTKKIAHQTACAHALHHLAREAAAVAGSPNASGGGARGHRGDGGENRGA